MPKLDFEALEATNRTGYPAPYGDAVRGRWVRRIAPVAGLRDFGVSHVRLDPGAMSSQRHWHEQEDEFLVVIEGEAVLVDDAGRVTLRPGDCAAFPKNDGNGHHLVNESDGPCSFVVVGQSINGPAWYPDIDLMWDGAGYRHKDGRGY